MTVFIFQSELHKIAHRCASHPDRETGGSLFGYFTHSGMPVVFLATGPGPQARHAVTSLLPGRGIPDRLRRGKGLQARHATFTTQIVQWHHHSPTSKHSRLRFLALEVDNRGGETASGNFLRVEPR